MDTPKRIGRTIGMLLLVQLVGGPMVNFVLLGRALGPPGYLVNAAAHATQIGLAVMSSLAIAMATLGIAIAAWPVFRQHSRTLAMWLVALGAIGVATVAIESVTLLSLVSVSQSYASAGPADAGLYEALGATVRAARRAAHYLNLLVAGGTMLVFYAVLLRSALVPRALATLGVAGTALQLVAVAMPLFGLRMAFLLLLPMAVAHVATALWLLAKGFANREPMQAPARNPTRTERVLQ